MIFHLVVYFEWKYTWFNSNSAIVFTINHLYEKLAVEMVNTMNH